MTEFNVWCQSCLNGTGGDNSWAYASGAAAYLLNLLAEGASAGLVYEAWDGVCNGYNASTGQDAPGTWDFFGLFAVSSTGAGPKTYTPRKQFYTISQITKYVAPGATRIGVSGASSPLTALAFYNTNNGQFTLTGVTTSSSATTLSCALTSLPAIPSLGFYYTSSTTNLCYGGSVAVNNGAFSVVVPANCVFTLTYTNTVAGRPAPPAIIQQPQSEAVIMATNALFSVTASGAAPLGYQWQFNGTNLANGGDVSGATANVLTLTAVNIANAGNYALVVTNVNGSATSSVATLTVLLPATITVPPVAQTVQCGSNAAFGVSATGTPPLNYQWSVDSVPVTGATNTSLSLTNVHLPSHTVAVVVTNPYASATSSVPLTVQDTLAAGHHA